MMKTASRRRILIKQAFKTEDPFLECNLQDYFKIPVPVTSLTKAALRDLELDNKSILRSKNMFALGLVCWIFSKPLDYIEGYIKKKFGKKSFGYRYKPQGIARRMELWLKHGAYDSQVCGSSG